MALKNYMPRHSDGAMHTAGKALKQSLAPDHSPEQPVKAGSENRTPSPTRPFDPLTARDSAWGRANSGRNNPGANSYDGPSSLPAGTKADAAAIDAGGSDEVMQSLLRGGAKALDVTDDWQSRDVDKTQLPAAGNLVKRGIDSGSPGGVVPASTGVTTGADDSAARRADRLKG